MGAELENVEREKKWELGWVLRGFNGPVRRRRRAKGLTQKQLADIVGVGVHIVSKLELLLMRPTPELRHNLADFLELDEQDVWPDWLEPRDNPIAAVAYQEVDAKTFSMLDSKVKKEVLQLEDHSRDAAKEVDAVFVKEKLRQVMKTLTYRERTVLELRFGLKDGMVFSLSECARILNLSIERVRQVEAKALRKLRSGPRAEHLESTATEVLGVEFCGHCHAVCGVGRFCAGCGRPGCQNCLDRANEGGKYAYRCTKCKLAETPGPGKAP